MCLSPEFTVLFCFVETVSHTPQAGSKVAACLKMTLNFCFCFPSAGVTRCTTGLSSCGASIKPKAFYTLLKHQRLSYISSFPCHPSQPPNNVCCSHFLSLLSLSSTYFNCTRITCKYHGLLLWILQQIFSLRNTTIVEWPNSGNLIFFQ